MDIVKYMYMYKPMNIYSVAMYAYTVPNPYNKHTHTDFRFLGLESPITSLITLSDVFL